MTCGLIFLLGDASVAFICILVAARPSEHWLANATQEHMNDHNEAAMQSSATPPRLRRRRTVACHRVLLYTTCYNVIDG